jgi:UDP-N-acetylmuramoylalanine--D-glutamate ligase
MRRLIVGLGVTGLATARYCLKQGWSFDLCDSREQPPGLAEARALCPDATITTGALSAELLCQYAQLIVSPGVALSDPAIQAADELGVEIIGDIELFARHLNELSALGSPVPAVVAITGSNGKSTVTSLLQTALRAGGLRAEMAGNIGIPALDWLPALGTEDRPLPDVFVLELSSFQLETTFSLIPAIATLLNLSEDHMDRYSGMDDYLKAKQRIFTNANSVLVNLDDAASLPPQPGLFAQLAGFSLGEARRQVRLGLKDLEQQLGPYAEASLDSEWLLVERTENGGSQAGSGNKELIQREILPAIGRTGNGSGVNGSTSAAVPEEIHWLTAADLNIKGVHNLANTLAVLGLLHGLLAALARDPKRLDSVASFDHQAALAAICEFPGLAHRCQWVAEHRGVLYFNDSKGTNVGSTLAAIEGLGPECTGRLHLLLGGDAKGQDFAPLRQACNRHVGGIYAYGKDGQTIHDQLAGVDSSISRYEQLKQAFDAAVSAAVEGDFVLLSPAAPELVLVVVVDEPQGREYYGGEVAAPVFSRIMEQALRMRQAPPDDLAGMKVQMAGGPE